MQKGKQSFVSKLLLRFPSSHFGISVNLGKISHNQNQVPYTNFWNFGWIYVFPCSQAVWFTFTIQLKSAMPCKGVATHEVPFEMVSKVVWEEINLLTPPNHCFNLLSTTLINWGTKGHWSQCAILLINIFQINQMHPKIVKMGSVHKVRLLFPQRETSQLWLN